MKFRRPNWGDLSNAQRNIVQLPLDDDFVIPGSPGTGKTVLAMYRIEQIVKEAKGRVLFLVYNKPLRMYLEAAFKNDKAFNGAEVSTYDSWVQHLYPRNRYPIVEGGDSFDYDWDQIKTDMSSHKDYYDHVVLDEAQDFPEDLLEILQIISKNITCFIDVNQKIFGSKSPTPIEKFIKLFCKKSQAKLITNYRNSKNIAEFSRAYLIDEKNFAIPGGSTITNNKILVRKCDELKQLDMIYKIIEHELGKSIGIIVDSKRVNKIYEALKERCEKNKIPLQKYGKKGNYTLSFEDDYGVQIVTFGTMKGLEYDLVIIPYFDNLSRVKLGKFDSPDEADRINTNRIYVAITRAREKLVILYENITDRTGKAAVMGKLVNKINNNPEIFELEKIK